MVAMVDANRCPLNLSPKGEPQLGKRGLYGAMGGSAPGEFQHALLWVLSLADGRHDLVEMARRSGKGFELIEQAATALEKAALLRSHGCNRTRQKQQGVMRGAPSCGGAAASLRLVTGAT